MRLREIIQVKSFEAWFHSMSLVEELKDGVSLNFFKKSVITEPYPHFNRLREKAPVHYSLAARAYWVTRFDWVQEVLRDKRFGADVRQIPARAERIRKVISGDSDRRESFENPSMLNLDPPDHSRIRRLVSQGFMHKFIQSLEPRIEHLVDNCLRRSDNNPTFDVIEDVAKPLPAFVIAEMMGLPEADHEQFQAWSEDLIEGTGTNELDKLERATMASRRLVSYFRKIIAERRGNPGDDLIGQLILAEEAGDKLNEQELYNTCLLLLVAGHETTTRLIGNGLWLLMTHRDQWDDLKANPDKLPGAIEEMLRFEPPVQATARFALEDMEFHGQQLKFGDQLFLSIAGANRDPDANDAPETFDINREKPKQVSFGYGIHLCIGASLARLEARVVFANLLIRYPDLNLPDQTPHWGTNPFFRGLEVLQVDKGSSSTTAIPDSPATA